MEDAIYGLHQLVLVVYRHVIAIPVLLSFACVLERQKGTSLSLIDFKDLSSVIIWNYCPSKYASATGLAQSGEGIEDKNMMLEISIKGGHSVMKKSRE
ncbi:hypothetical protein L6164_025335 [Bauhinia variegata]|uniref:Uncharacterized protein n=1 Tax=Bauhinia variegata TaxID=167791 RepID=A0ACB9M0K8_BAUVA|nr:hypothetical protein L6164_025335 [Bauhinia variegata]